MGESRSGRDLLYGLPLGVPWGALALIASCVTVTLPLFWDPARYYLILGTGFCEQENTLRWYHPLLSHFVHGAGCGFPSTWLHLAINTSLFLFHGALFERLLGSARFALLTGTNLVFSSILSEILVGGRVHGASDMAWSYGLFVAWVLGARWRDRRWRMFREPLTTLIAFWLLLAAIGLIKHWHLWSVLISVPYLLAWRNDLTEQLGRDSRTPTRADHAAAVGCMALYAFNVVMVVLAVLGLLGSDS
jgi:membrane associated rhomboid family serine protease